MRLRPWPSQAAPGRRQGEWGCGSAGGAAECADVLDPVRAEQVEVDRTLDNDDLAAPLERPGEQAREPVGWQAAPGGAAQVEVLARARLALVGRSRPERSRLAAFVAPATDDPPRPTGVGEHPRAGKLAPGVAATLAPGEHEHRLQELGTPVTRPRPRKRCRVDTRPFGQHTNAVDEVTSSR